MLEWIDRDHEQAGRKLEQIRRRVIEILASRGCYDAEYWADETIDRVASKIDEVVEGYEGNPAYYFYGVAKRVYLECMKKRPPSYSARVPNPPGESDDVEREHMCLEHCLARLSDEDRELVLGYYSKERREKIVDRDAMARERGIGLNALRIRVYRIRIVLKGCIQDCLRREGL